MGWQGWFTLAVLAVMIVGLAREVAGPDLILMAGLFALASVGVLTPAQTFQGFANPAIAAIGALFIVSAGLRETGVLEMAATRLFGNARSGLAALVRMCPPVAAFSAFLNNAPIVAMMTPVVIEWSRRHRLSPSRFLIPLSYATILGSLTTLIGTGVNLTVAGLLVQNHMTPMRFFELAPVGLPVCLVGLIYVVFLAPRWLPERRELAEELGERRREYMASMRVQSGSRFVGQSIEAAGLRQLPGSFLVEIDRRGRTITPVGPEETLESGDRLVFAGIVATIVDLQRMPGLEPDHEEEPPVPARDRRLIEAVISTSSPLIGQSIRDAGFRTRYDAAVVAVHRNGERLGGKVGAVVLRPGDTLLLQTAPGFLRTHRNSPDFFLVSDLAAGPPLRTERAWVALAILGSMVAVAALGIWPISIASFLAAGALIATRCITGQTARQSVQWSVLIVIGAGFGIAEALYRSGAAHFVADGLVAASGGLGPLATMAVVYLATTLVAEMLHHAAAVAIMVPIAIATAGRIDVDPRAFVIAVTMAANCAFANPVTYQTHLIVYGPGGYRFRDFVRAGLPLDLLCCAVSVAVIPLFWPL